MGIGVSAAGPPGMMAIIDGDAVCSGAMALVDGAGLADDGDGHQTVGVGRTRGAMAIVRMSPKPSREVSR
jgi:hypothetical protein